MAHGGDCYSHPVRMDFSVNLNPLGIPENVKKALAQSVDRADRYPDTACRALTSALAEYLETDPAHILFGNGASELLMALVHALRPAKTLVPVPSFSGYAHALRASDGAVLHYEMRAADGFALTEDFLKAILPEIDLLFLTSPNNPTGRYIEAVLLRQILDRCRQQGTTVVLDECFMALSDDPDANTLLHRYRDWPNLVLLRAFTKSFAVPGVRLGYLLCADEERLERIRRHLPEWNLSVPAQAAGLAALSEPDWTVSGRKVIGTERPYLKAALAALGFECVPSSAGYLLFRDAKARGIDLYRKLLEQGTLIRDCSDYAALPAGYYRIAVKDHGENAALIRQITAVAEAYQEKENHEKSGTCPPRGY